MLNNVYFITGFPGFLATRLLKELLFHYPDERYRLLVLDKEMDGARRLLNELRSDSKDIQLVTGDITQKDLGIEPDLSKSLQSEITHAFHLAALYDLTASRAACEMLNVNGTRNVTEWLAHCPFLQRYSYFSTAYVSGTRQGVIKENELILPERFRNHYEETKYLAEKMVEEAKSRMPVTIFRPGIVTGNSSDGETQKFDGPYYLLTFLSKLKHLPVPMIGDGTALIHLVPYDFVIRSAVFLTHQKQSQNKTYHLINPSSPTIKEAFVSMLYELHGKQTKFTIPVSLASVVLTPRFIQRLAGVPKEALDYFSGKHNYDCSLLIEDLSGSDISCPPFGRLAPTMVNFYREHANNRQFMKTF